VPTLLMGPAQLSPWAEQVLLAIEELMQGVSVLQVLALILTAKMMRPGLMMMRLGLAAALEPL